MDKIIEAHKAIIFAGTIGAGKTTASKYIIEKYHYIHLSYVDLIWLPILEERKISATREHLQDLGDELRETYGLRELAKMIIPYIPADTSVVIDDVRHPDVYDELKKTLTSKVYLIYIETGAENRESRLEIRDNLESMEELIEIEKRATEITIEDLKMYADFVIYNNNCLEDFYEKIDECMKKIGGDE